VAATAVVLAAGILVGGVHRGDAPPDALAAPGGEVTPTAPRAPVTAQEFFDRGLRKLRTGPPTPEVAADARADFFQSDRLVPSSRATAYVAYCYALESNHRDAAVFTEETIRAGADTPAVRTIAGYAYLNHKQPDTAFRHLDAAVEANPNYWPARYHRALARYQERAGDGGVEDMAVLRAGGPPAADISHLAVQIFHRAANYDPAFRPMVREAIADAVRQGRKVDKYSRVPTYKTYFDEFPELAGLTADPAEQARPPLPRLPEPEM
jgi:hypothetical protein